MNIIGVIDVANSASEVPIAITVSPTSPIKISLIRLPLFFLSSSLVFVSLYKSPLNIILFACLINLIVYIITVL